MNLRISSPLAYFDETALKAYTGTLSCIYNHVVTRLCLYSAKRAASAEFAKVDVTCLFQRSTGNALFCTNVGL